MPFGYWFYDYYYIILVLPAVLFAMFAQFWVQSAFRRYSQVMMQSHFTGREIAELVLRQNGVSGVKIEQVSGKLSDHFDPRTNVIRLSQEVYGSPSVASAGVAAHEAGHAVQYAKGYGPIRLRTAIIPLCNFGSGLSMPLVLVGIFFSWQPLAMAGVLLFGLATLFQLVTLPVELNASKRAMTALRDSRLLLENELDQSKKMLRAAALTYVAALFVSLMNFLRLFMLVRDRGDRS